MFLPISSVQIVKPVIEGSTVETVVSHLVAVGIVVAETKLKNAVASSSFVWLVQNHRGTFQVARTRLFFRGGQSTWNGQGPLRYFILVTGRYLTEHQLQPVGT